jgi:hypothetical protein
MVVSDTPSEKLGTHSTILAIFVRSGHLFSANNAKN